MSTDCYGLSNCTTVRRSTKQENQMLVCSQFQVTHLRDVKMFPNSCNFGESSCGRLSNSEHLLEVCVEGDPPLVMLHRNQLFIAVKLFYSFYVADIFYPSFLAQGINLVTKKLGIQSWLEEFGFLYQVNVRGRAGIWFFFLSKLICFVF